MSGFVLILMIGGVCYGLWWAFQQYEKNERDKQDKAIIQKYRLPELEQAASKAFRTRQPISVEGLKERLTAILVGKDYPVTAAYLLGWAAAFYEKKRSKLAFGEPPQFGELPVGMVRDGQMDPIVTPVVDYIEKAKKLQEESQHLTGEIERLIAGYWRALPPEAPDGFLAVNLEDLYEAPPMEKIYHLEYSDLRSYAIGFFPPEKLRFEHQWIVAGSGHGKTQLLQAMIATDLPRVAKGECSIVVIDSQKDMIRNLSSLKFFAEHPDRLVIVDPEDMEYPIALNLFDMGRGRFDKRSLAEKEMLLSSVTQVLDYVLGALLSDDLTAKQGTLFRFVTRLMLEIEGANLRTFLELMTKEGYAKYEDYVSRLGKTAQEFFRTQFNVDKQYKETKEQIVRRLWDIMESGAFSRMFSNPRSKLDLFKEMNSGKVILVNTAQSILGEEPSKLFGRFFIALITQAAQERATLPEDQRLPTFVYVDEAHEYIDDRVGVMLEQARKRKIGLILAHQYLGQLNSKIYENLKANTSIQLVGGASIDDAQQFAKMMQRDVAEIKALPKGKFMGAFGPMFSGKGVTVSVPHRVVETMPQMTAAEFKWLQTQQRARYAVHVSETEVPDEPAPAMKDITPEPSGSSGNAKLIEYRGPSSDQPGEW
ncbi:type IV secretory system conjugative DNA transfer family protein [Dongia sp.]|uniref:type IV secretory system conjugative DNA transfer family protein n=1 Tax=Dongia sp. TaxID=1977262 RepID=UPI00375319EB